MEKSVFEIVKAPLGWSVFADNVKIGGVYDSRGAALEAAALAASYTVSNGGGVQIIVPGADQERPRWGIAVRHVDGRLTIEERALGHRRKRRPVARFRAAKPHEGIAQF